ncbi:MAG: hypothetical protein IPH69_14855 [Bacteroidales bacterium]|nr:hypothetical protein [Bacteroidales bacterium]
MPFLLVDDRTFKSHFIPEHTGLYFFWAEFSMDKGTTWIRDNVPDAWILIDPPQIDGLRLYTLIPNVSGTIKDWKEDLIRIKGMGFNAVHLLPVTALDSSESPYSAKDLFDIDTSYLEIGSKNDSLVQIEDFVDEAKMLGISLCFDIVMNHVGTNSNIAKKAPDWIIPDHNKPDGFLRAGYWSERGWLEWDDLILINYEHPSARIRKEIWDYMTEYALFWANYASETGGFIRFDNLHSSDPKFVQSLAESLHNEYPDVAILGEFFTDETNLLQKSAQWGLNLNLATPWNYRFVPQLRDYLNYIHRSSKHLRYFMPVTTHDSGTPYQEFGSVESTMPRYVSAALMGTGATGITQGVEYGITEKIQFIGRQTKMKFPDEIRFSDFILKVNSILAEYIAFRCGDNCFFVDKGHDAIIAVYRYDPTKESSGFLVICNFDIFKSQEVTIDLLSFIGVRDPLQSIDLLSGENHEFLQSQINLFLQPCQAMVLKIH